MVDTVRGLNEIDEVGQFQSRVCFMMFLNANTLSMHPFLFRNPACSCSSFFLVNSCLDSSKKDYTENFAGEE